MLKSLHRLLLTAYLESKGETQIFSGLTEDKMETLFSVVSNPLHDNLSRFLADNDLAKHIEGYTEFCETVRQGQLGKTSQFWMTYMDHISLVLSLMRAVKTNDFLLYAYCIEHMPDLFFSFGGHNYAKYLTYFSVYISNLELGSIKDIKMGVFSVARSMIPGNRFSVDKTMEETFMRNAKSRGGAGGGGAGICGIAHSYAAYQRWIRTTHERSKYLNATYAMVDFLDDSHTDKKHRELRPANIHKSETSVKNTIEAFNNFINPFSIDEKEHLYNISSGARIPSHIEDDVLKSELAGKKEKDVFIAERLQVNDNFFQPLRNLKLKTMADMNKKVQLKTGQNKVIVYKQQGNIAFQLLVLSQGLNSNIDLKEVMKHQLTPIPYCIGSADGFLGRSNKAKGFHFLTSDLTDATQPNPEITLLVVDGNALFHSLTEIPGNFKDICTKVFNMIPGKSDILFSTDMYHANSIKAMERKRRGCGEKLLLKGPSTKRPYDWKDFLSNNDNKKQLVDVLLDVWSDASFAKLLKDRKVILICEGKAFKLTANNRGTAVCRKEVFELRSTQEETDTRTIIYAAYAERTGYKCVRVRSPDSDIYFILLHHAPKLKVTMLFDTGTGNSRSLLNITEIALSQSQHFSTALMSLHAYTGCDTTSSFKGIGKQKPLKVLQKMPIFGNVLAKLGDCWEISEDILEELEHFTCYLYGQPRFRKVDSLRLHLLIAKCDNNGRLDPSKTMDIASLPPCTKTLVQHIKRTNLQVGIWKRANENFPELPDPTEHGWTMIGENLEPLWCEGNVLPQQMIEVLASNDIESEDENEVETVNMDTSDIFYTDSEDE